jgi:TRAP-type C4-dicarboxylate transport system permease small subunit
MSIVRFFKTLSNYADYTAQCLAVPIIFSYIFLIFTGVVSRFILKIPIMGAVIYSRVGFVWTCLLGATLAYKRMKHIRFTFFVNLLPVRLGKMEEIGIHLLSLGFFVWVLIHAINTTWRVWPSKISGTDISNGVMYGALPLALILMLIHCLNHIAECISVLSPEREDTA